MEKTTDRGAAKKKPVVVKKPYLTGSIWDSTVIRSALMICGSMIIVAILYLIVCGVLTFDNTALRVLTNGLVAFVVMAMFYYSGIGRGTVAVNQGEIMYHRRETGQPIAPEELSRCFHIGKGFVTGLLGTLPLFLCALILAVVAKEQNTGLGALPSWVSGLETRDEVGLGLTYYHTPVMLGLEGVLRIIIRLSIMPFVNMVGAANRSGLLTLERLSPLIVLLPGIAYGLGYTRGVQVRTQVHSDIARNARKRRKKSRREKARKRRAPKGPEALN